MIFNISLNNYESLKLNVQHPEYINLLILVFILCVCFVSIRKTNAARILSKDQTDQLKGLAIIAVILGHLWVHAVGNIPKLLFSGEAVAMFLILSGYGLTSSYGNRKVQHGSYIAARIMRVMIPYCFFVQRRTWVDSTVEKVVRFLLACWQQSKTGGLLSWPPSRSLSEGSRVY